MSVGLGWSEGVGRRGKFPGVASLGMWLPVHLVSAGEVLGVPQNIVQYMQTTIVGNREGGGCQNMF